MRHRKISKNEIVILSLQAVAVILVLLFLFTPLGFVFGGLVLLPLLSGVGPASLWCFVCVLVFGLIWWISTERSKRTVKPAQGAKAMTTVSIKFSNFNDEPISLQVDPWAGLYVLKKGEEIEIVAESEKSSPSITTDEHGTTRIITLWDSADLGYYVVVNGQRIHWQDYYLDSRLCSKCLKYLDAEDASGNICRCGKVE